MPLPPRWVRRLLLPIFAAIEVALLGSCLAVLIVALVVAPLTSRRRVLRVAAFAGSYLVMELVVLMVGTLLWMCLVVTRRSDEWWERMNFAVLRGALTMVLLAARRTVGFELVVDQRSMVLDPADTTPLLVLCRHAGLGDSFAVVHLLLEAWNKRVRIVMKETLQWDPALDVILNRVSTCFISPRSMRGGSHATDRLGELASGIRPGDALLLFPEGANWTPDRHERAVQSLQRRGKLKAARIAERLSHVLPLRPAGVLSCLAARSDFTLAVVAHTGIDELVTVGSVWRALPIRVPMELRSWIYPNELVPRDADTQMNWLTLEWAIVDEWIDLRKHESSATGPG